ncbi:hypothetical protein VNO77_02795 [Canavalia gladiata]|uniref:Uncharacterized protein n=1 Tax=Canavalia gladiata TaxID=3824 RepID=A0AAN9R685_CANGL
MSTPWLHLSFRYSGKELFAYRHVSCIQSREEWIPLSKQLINVKANTKSWVGVEILIAKSRPLDSTKRLVKWLSARCHTPKSRFRIPAPNFC